MCVRLLWASASSKAGKKMAHFFFPVCPLTLPFLQGKESCSHIAQEWTWTLRHVPPACSLLTIAAFTFNPETGWIFPAQLSHPCTHQCHSPHDSGVITPPMLLTRGCPGHKGRFYLLSKSLIIFNWSKSEKNVSSQPRLKIITIAVLKSFWTLKDCRTSG